MKYLYSAKGANNSGINDAIPRMFGITVVSLQEKNFMMKEHFITKHSLNTEAKSL